MGSWFDAEAETNRAIVDEFGERFTYMPYRVGIVNFPAQPDSSRVKFDFDAVFERESTHVKLGMEDAGVSTRDPCVHALVCDIPYAVKQFDRLLHHDTGELFEIIDPKPDGLSGIAIKVVQLGRAAR